MATTGPEHVEADVIVVTHAHGDYWGDSASISQRTGEILISNPVISHYSEGRGARVKSIGIGGTYAFDGGWVKYFPWHSSCFPDGIYGGRLWGL